jgi:hypothetical protein
MAILICVSTFHGIHIMTKSLNQPYISQNESLSLKVKGHMIVFVWQKNRTDFHILSSHLSQFQVFFFFFD